MSSKNSPRLDLKHNIVQRVCVIVLATLVAATIVYYLLRVVRKRLRVFKELSAHGRSTDVEALKTQEDVKSSTEKIRNSWTSNEPVQAKEVLVDSKSDTSSARSSQDSDSSYLRQPSQTVLPVLVRSTEVSRHEYRVSRVPVRY